MCFLENPFIIFLSILHETNRHGSAPRQTLLTEERGVCHGAATSNIHEEFLRIQILSDLHNEFEPYEPLKVECDVTILAGDVGLGMNGLKWATTVFQDRPVVYVAGNHEYYGNALPHLTNKLRESCKGTSVHFLECESVSINGVRFLGCTLWSDFAVASNRLESMEVAQDVMTDYKRIRLSPKYRKLRPIDTGALHAASFKWLRECLPKSNEPTVVVTHHAPSPRSLKPGTENDPVNGAYASRLDDWVGASNILLWVHGHTHYCVDYTIGNTRVLSNQRGYPDQPAQGFRPDLLVDV